MEIVFRVLERATAQGEEALDVPLPEVRLCGIDEDREIKKVRDEGNRPPSFVKTIWQKHIQPFDDQNIWTIDRN